MRAIVLGMVVAALGFAPGVACAASFTLISGDVTTNLNGISPLVLLTTAVPVNSVITTQSVTYIGKQYVDDVETDGGVEPESVWFTTTYSFSLPPFGTISLGDASGGARVTLDAPALLDVSSSVPGG